MIDRITRLMAAAALTVGFVGLLASPATAHEERAVGDFDLTVGFGTEPAYVGEPNSAILLLSRGGRPVVDLGDTLSVDVSFGDAAPFPLSVEPFFEEGEFGTPGDYRAWFIPTSAGQYTFHFTGTIDGQDVDETFVSGPQTFNDVETPTDAEYPDQPPSTSELADRIDREVPRLNDAIGGVKSSALAAAQSASDDASGARTVGVIGVAVGGLGLIAAAAAIGMSRRARA